MQTSRDDALSPATDVGTGQSVLSLEVLSERLHELSQIGCGPCDEPDDFALINVEAHSCGL
uniref:Uncharacterized protein n=1 Tax=uncultured prokaryote TaxID=198431 RepID=A0A0H5Q2G4_9ZZZZ|nr:hypothetical protein [uncultured prokaryote]